MSDPIGDLFRRPTTSWTDLLPVTRGDLINALRPLWNYVLAQTEANTVKFEELEALMSAVDDLIGRFAAATDEIAAELSQLRDEVAGLDAATAAKFEPLVARLEALGADPQNPVPSPEPAPEPAPEPTPEPEPAPEPAPEG